MFGKKKADIAEELKTTNKLLAELVEIKRQETANKKPLPGPLDMQTR